MKHLRASLRLAGFSLFICVSLVPLILAMLVSNTLHSWILRQSYRVCTVLFGVRVQIEGQTHMPHTGPVWVVSNHVSYVDVFVFGSLFPMRFTPKKEVAGWPVLGWITRLCRVIYLERKSSKAGRQHTLLTQALRNKESIILFPEGTTSDGTTVLPFKSSLFAAAIDTGTPILPLALSYHVPEGGNPVPWYGDMTLLPHLWQFLGLKSVIARVACLPIIPIDERAERKKLAQQTQQQIAAQIALHRMQGV